MENTDTTDSRDSTQRAPQPDLIPLRRVAVTGASGNVGTALLRALARSHPDCRVTGLARRPPSADSPPEPPPEPYDRVDWIGCDIGAFEATETMTEAFRGADAVVHLAWAIQPSRDERLLGRTNLRGTRNVLDAVVAAEVPQVVHASSIGTYSPGPAAGRVDESWPTAGVPSSYSRHKAACERMLDALERQHPAMTVARLRPGLVFQQEAGSEIARYFLGPLVPTRLVGSGRLPVVPLPDGLDLQAVHADDLADAIVTILEHRATGAFNLAAEPVLRPDLMASLLGGRRVRVPAGLVRRAAAISWRLGLQPTEPGWVDMGMAAPVMDTSRARTELGWTPRHDAADALLAVLSGMREGSGGDSPVLRARESAGRNVRQLARGKAPGSPTWS
jgi:UDP-glucose 4-epimerase